MQEINILINQAGNKTAQKIELLHENTPFLCSKGLPL